MSLVIKMKFSAVILGAGSGTRCGLGYNKLLHQSVGKTILEQTVEVFENKKECDQIVLVISQKDEAIMKEIFQDRVTYVIGGATRLDSSVNGVAMVNNEYCMIHDGARPYVSHQEIDDCLHALEIYDACLLMVPVKDTIKVVENSKVVSTPNRSTLMAALTPQCFKTTLIRQCLKQAQLDQGVFSDDASVVEAYSDVDIHVVEGSYANIKITTKEDLR